MEKQKTNNNTLQIQEIQEANELNTWAKTYQKEITGKRHSMRSNELGGHQELKEGESDRLIGPSEEKVQELLKDCGMKLGIHYVNR